MDLNSWIIGAPVRLQMALPWKMQCWESATCPPESEGHIIERLPKTAIDKIQLQVQCVVNVMCIDISWWRMTGGHFASSSMPPSRRKCPSSIAVRAMRLGQKSPWSADSSNISQSRSSWCQNNRLWWFHSQLLGVQHFRSCCNHTVSQMNLHNQQYPFPL